jgi:hypothetical protein
VGQSSGVSGSTRWLAGVQGMSRSQLHRPAYPATRTSGWVVRQASWMRSRQARSWSTSSGGQDRFHRPPTTARAAFRNYHHLPRGLRPGLSASRAVRATMRSLPTVSKTPENDAHSRRPQLTLPATETYTHRGAIIVSRTTSTPVAAASNTINIITRAGSPTTLQIRATKVCGSSVRILIGSRGRPLLMVFPHSCGASLLAQGGRFS